MSLTVKIVVFSLINHGFASEAPTTIPQATSRVGDKPLGGPVRSKEEHNPRHKGRSHKSMAPPKFAHLYSALQASNARGDDDAKTDGDASVTTEKVAKNKPHGATMLPMQEVSGAQTTVIKQSSFVKKESLVSKHGSHDVEQKPSKASLVESPTGSPALPTVRPSNHILSTLTDDDVPGSNSTAGTHGHQFAAGDPEKGLASSSSSLVSVTAIRRDGAPRPDELDLEPAGPITGYCCLCANGWYAFSASGNCAKHCEANRGGCKAKHKVTGRQNAWGHDSNIRCHSWRSTQTVSSTDTQEPSGDYPCDQMGAGMDTLLTRADPEESSSTVSSTVSEPDDDSSTLSRTSSDEVQSEEREEEPVEGTVNPGVVEGTVNPVVDQNDTLSEVDDKVDEDDGTRDLPQNRSQELEQDGGLEQQQNQTLEQDDEEMDVEGGGDDDRMEVGEMEGVERGDLDGESMEGGEREEMEQPMSGQKPSGTGTTNTSGGSIDEVDSLSS